MEGKASNPSPSTGRQRPTCTVGSSTAAGAEGTAYVREANPNQLLLNPVSSKVQRIAVYETKTVSATGL